MPREPIHRSVTDALGVGKVPRLAAPTTSSLGCGAAGAAHPEWSAPSAGGGARCAAAVGAGWVAVGGKRAWVGCTSKLKWGGKWGAGAGRGGRDAGEGRGSWALLCTGQRDCLAFAKRGRAGVQGSWKGGSTTAAARWGRETGKGEQRRGPSLPAREELRPPPPSCSPWSEAKTRGCTPWAGTGLRDDGSLAHIRALCD